ncbi:MAG: nucleotidyltransferase domain-containing protein, partial [Deltaproteobacteria bacterium]|nr:nucleotidyltransferase domain-containing protein [Deltaproteobacteria bacterium]
LVRGTFHERSDIDLAVEGLPPGGLLDALAAADGSAFRFDVIPLEIAPPYIREAAEKEGVVLWPR